MEITYGSLQLADGSAAKPAAGWALPTQQLVGRVSGVGRAANTPTARGNRSRQISGSVERSFSTLAAAVKFWAGHEASLANSGNLVFGVGGVTCATFAAVLESVTCQPPRGVSVRVDYVFSLSGPATIAS